MLGFQTESGVFAEGGAVGAGQIAEVIGGIELDAGLRGGDLHDSPGFWIGRACEQHRLFAVAIQDVIVVIAPGTGF